MASTNRNYKSTLDLDGFAGKRILVTGHTGFKGSWLAIWLRSLGAEVSGISLDPPTSPSNYVTSGLGELLANDLRVDIRSYRDLLHGLELVQPDVIFHLAAQPIVAYGVDNPYETFNTNIMGTVALLEAVRTRKRPCVVVVFTSDKCYVNKETERGYKETDPLGGSEPYGSSKAGAEIVVNAYRDAYFTEGVPGYFPVYIASARAGNVIGGGDWSPHRIVPDIVRSLAANKPVGLRSPDAIRPWQHVLEPLYGYILLAEKMLSSSNPEKFAQAWNFGPPATELVSVRQLVEMAIKIWGKGSWESIDNPYTKHEKGLLLLDSTKATEMLGWSPKWDFAQTIEKTVRWYRSHSESLDQKNTLSLCEVDLADYNG